VNQAVPELLTWINYKRPKARFIPMTSLVNLDKPPKDQIREEMGEVLRRKEDATLDDVLKSLESKLEENKQFQEEMMNSPNTRTTDWDSRACKKHIRKIKEIQKYLKNLPDAEKQKLETELDIMKSTTRSEH